MKRLAEIRARLAELKEELSALAGKPELVEEEEVRMTAGLAEWDQLTEEAKPLEEREAQLERVKTASVKESNIERGDGAGDGETRDNRGRKEQLADLYNVDQIRASMYGKAPGALSAELRSRAMTAVEKAPEHMTHEHRESATKLLNPLNDPKGEIAEHILRTGSPEYHEAFFRYMQGDTRAAMTLTGANGGYLVPFTLDPTIILTNNGATNPFRAISTIKTITTDDWNGVTSAGVTAEWLAEATEAADASPTFTQPTITPAKGAAWVQASLEVTMDSGVASEIGMLIADAKDRLEATAFAVGTGSGQPQGVVTGVAAVTASRVAGSSGAGGAATYVVADVYALQNALPPRYRPNSSWVAEQTTLNATRQFATGSGPQHAFWTDLGPAIPSQLLGRPVYESSAMDNTIVSGSNDDVLLIGDFRAGYYVVDRVGVSILFENLVKGSNRRPTGEVGWFAYWRVGGGVVDANAFRLLRL